MRWRRRKKHSEEAEQAKRQARQNLARARARWPEVHRVATSLKEVREANHFAERIENLIRGGI